MKQCYSLLKKQKKPFRFLQQGRRERGWQGEDSFLNEIYRNIQAFAFKVL